MDEEVIQHMREKIDELTKERDELQLAVREWQARAWAAHGEYMDLYEQLRRGDFVKRVDPTDVMQRR